MMPPRIAVLALLLLPSRAAVSMAPAPHESRVRLFNSHTQERIDVVYKRGEDYLPDAAAQLDLFLRDHRRGEVHRVDPRLFDLLSDLSEKVGRPGAEIEIVCGYRTPQTNEFLRRSTAGVARGSLHMRGEAIDIRLPGTRTARLRDAALDLRRGGVGYYRDSDFIHIDVGRVRRW